MILKNVIDKFTHDSFIKDLDKELVIQTQGLSGSCVKVKCIAPGFDWYHGRIVITPEIPLLNCSLKKYSRLREKLLKEISSIKRDNECEAFQAKYRKEIRFFDNIHDAEVWVTEKLNEELENV